MPAQETLALMAIICVTIITLMCISHAINGNIIYAAIIAIAALGGVDLYQKLKANKT